MLNMYFFSFLLNMFSAIVNFYGRFIQTSSFAEISSKKGKLQKNILTSSPLKGTNYMSGKYQKIANSTYG